MTNPIWFFSSLAQTIAAISGFMITIGVVLYQLDQNERRNRTELLREELMDFNKKYQAALNSVMEYLKQPYETDIPNDVLTSSQLSHEAISDLITNTDREYPVRDEAWLHCRNLQEIIDNITSDGKSGDIYTLTDAQIDELVSSGEKLSELVHSGESTLQQSIQEAEDRETLSVTEEVFNDQTNEYLNLAAWFNQYLDDHRQSDSLNGTNLLSISVFFDELRNDALFIKSESKHTVIGQDVNLLNVLRPVLLLILFGIAVPLIFIVALQTGIFSPSTLIELQITLLVVVSALFMFSLLSLLNKI